MNKKVESIIEREKDYFDKKWGERIATDYYWFEIRTRVGIVKKYLSNNANILDIGCGDGTITQKIARIDKVKQVFAIDVSEKGISYAKNHHSDPKITYLCSDIMKEDIKDKFDLIYMYFLLEHLEHPEEMLKKIKDLLAMEGYLIIGVPNRLRFENRLRRLFKKPSVLCDSSHIKEQSLKETKNFIGSSGFEVLEILGRGLWGSWVSCILSGREEKYKFLWENSLNYYLGAILPGMANCLYFVCKKR